MANNSSPDPIEAYKAQRVKFLAINRLATEVAEKRLEPGVITSILSDPAHIGTLGKKPGDRGAVEPDWLLMADVMGVDLKTKQAQPEQQPDTRRRGRIERPSA